MKNKILKRTLSVLLCACVFCCSFTVTAFAVSTGLDLTLSILEAVLNIKETVGLLDEYLNAVSDLHTSQNIAATSTAKVAWKKIYTLFKNPSDFKTFVNDLLKFDTYVSSGVSDPYSEFRSKYGDEFEDVFLEMLNIERMTFPNSSEISLGIFDDVDALCSWLASSSSNGYDLTSDNKVQVPSKDFKDQLGSTNNQFFPKNAAGKMSYRTDSRWKNKYPDATNYRYMSVYDKSTKFTAVGGDEMYFVFFYKTAEDTYYSGTQYHFTMTVSEEWYEDRDEISGYNYTITAEYWDMVDGLSTNRSDLDFYQYTGNFVDSLKLKIENVGYNCFDMCCYGYFSFRGLKKYSDYINYTTGSIVTDYYSYRFLQPSPIMYRSDMTTTINLTELLFTKFDGSDGVSDIGYIASTTPIETIYRIDTSKIPDNYYVTINGDTVYDYSITNPETGQSDTINNYITNNYTYVTGGDSGGSGSGGSGGSGTGGSGSVGGNIMVDGKVDVGGSVGVDINVNVPDINVNVNTSNVGGGDNLGDYVDTSGAATDIGGVIGKIPELSKGFTDYLKGFFAWLPPQIYGLVILLLFVTIWRALVKR